jgi:hypothetical protein
MPIGGCGRACCVVLSCLAADAGALAGGGQPTGPRVSSQPGACTQSVHPWGRRAPSPASAQEAEAGRVSRQCRRCVTCSCQRAEECDMQKVHHCINKHVDTCLLTAAAPTRLCLHICSFVGQDCLCRPGRQCLLPPSVLEPGTTCCRAGLHFVWTPMAACLARSHHQTRPALLDVASNAVISIMGKNHTSPRCSTPAPPSKKLPPNYQPCWPCGGVCDERPEA